jgi:hypothetical protein
LTLRDRAYEAHDPLRLAHFSLSNCRDDDQQRLVYSVLDVLASELPRQGIANAAIQHRIQLQYPSLMSSLDTINDGSPIVSVRIGAKAGFCHGWINTIGGGSGGGYIPKHVTLTRISRKSEHARVTANMV